MGDLTTAAGMLAEMAKKADVLDKTQAPLTKAFVEGKLNVDMSKYDATTKKAEYNNFNCCAGCSKAIDEAKDAIRIQLQMTRLRQMHRKMLLTRLLMLPSKANWLRSKQSMTISSLMISTPVP